MNYKRIGELADEFSALWNRLHAFYIDAAIGFASVRSSVEEEQKSAVESVKGTDLDSESFQDTRLFHYNKSLVEQIGTAHLHQSTQGEAKLRNTPDGENFTTLGQLCILSFYDFWQDYMRREYVIAKGKLDPAAPSKEAEVAMRENAAFNLWGDLRHLRNAIAHNRGVATEDCEKCKLIRIFTRGDRIVFTPEHMRAIFNALLVFRNEIDAERHPKVIINLWSS